MPRTRTGFITDSRITVGSYRHEVSGRTPRPLIADPRPFPWNANDPSPRFLGRCRMKAGIQGDISPNYYRPLRNRKGTLSPLGTFERFYPSLSHTLHIHPPRLTYRAVSWSSRKDGPGLVSPRVLAKVATRRKVRLRVSLHYESGLASPEVMTCSGCW